MTEKNEDIQAIRAIWAPGHVVEVSMEVVANAARTITELCDMHDKKDAESAQLREEMEGLRINKGIIEEINLDMQKQITYLNKLLSHYEKDMKHPLDCNCHSCRYPSQPGAK